MITKGVLRRRRSAKQPPGWTGRGMAPAKQSKSTQKSPAEFFAENKIIAGFDTPGKSLYTTVRELVENSLDAAERVGVLPDVDVTIEEISLESFNRHRGIEGPGARRDDRLYKDTETQTVAKIATKMVANVMAKMATKT